MKPRLFSTSRFSLLGSAIAALLAVSAPALQAQSTYTWNTTTNSTAWLNAGNWTGGPTSTFAGVDARAITTADGNSGDIASFTTLAWGGSNLGINFNNTSPSNGVANNGNANGSLTLGALDLNPSKAFTIGKSDTSTIASALTLSGATINSVANTILRNTSANTVTIAGFAGGSGTQAMSLALGNSTNNVINITGTGGITISSIISGSSRNLTRQGSGTGILTLSGANTYSGTTTVTAGTLRATTSAQALGLGALSLGGGTLQLANDTDINFARNTTVTATSTITADRVGAAAATTRTHTLGTLSIGAQTLNITRGNQINGAGIGGITFGAATMTADATFNTGASSLLTLGAVGGNFGLTKQGTGQLTLSTAGNYTGVTNVSAGVLGVGNNTALGTTDGNTVVASGSTVYGIAPLSALAEAFNISGSGAGTANALQIGGGGTTNLTGAVTLSGNSSIGTDGGVTLTMSGGIDTSGNTLTIAATGTAFNISTVGISGTGGALTKTQAGSLTISAASSYTGLTTVSAGDIIVTHADALGVTGSGTTVASGAAVVVVSGITTNSNESITVAGGGTNFGGALRGGTGGGTWAGTVNLGASARLGAAATSTLTVTGSIVNGAGSLAQISGDGGTGVIVINPTTSNSYTGNTEIIRGILRLGKTDALPTTTRLDVDFANNVAEASTFDMAGFNQTIAALQDTATTSINGKVTNSVVGTSTLTVNQSVDTNFGSVIEDGAVNQFVALTKSGSGNLTLSGSNTHTGGTNVNAGTLTLGHATNTLANTGAVNVNGGTLALGTNTDTVGSVTLTSGIISGSGAGRLTGTGSAYDVRSGTISAKLGGTVGLTKTTAGTVTISSDNSSGGYTGATAVNGGTLIIDGNISTSVTTVASGATIGGSGTTGALTVQSGGFITPGNSAGILTVNGNYAQAGLYTAEINGLTPGTQHDQIVVTGAVDITGGTLSTLFTGSYSLNNILFILTNDSSDLITGTFSGLAQDAIVTSYGGFDWKISYVANSGSSSFTGGNDIALMAIPEPNVAALVGGLGILALLRRRRLSTVA